MLLGLLGAGGWLFGAAGVAGGLAAFGLLALHGHRRPAQVARALAREDLAAQGEVVHLYSEDQLVVADALCTVTMRWERVLQAVETPSFLLLFVRKGLAYYLPLSAVPLAERPALRNLLQRRLGSRARLGPFAWEADGEQGTLTNA